MPDCKSYERSLPWAGVAYMGGGGQVKAVQTIIVSITDPTLHDDVAMMSRSIVRRSHGPSRLAFEGNAKLFFQLPARPTLPRHSSQCLWSDQLPRGFVPRGIFRKEIRC